MQMPGRGGHLNTSGLWQQTGTESGLPANPTYDLRTGNEPLEYKASQSITFLPGFESGEGDGFVAYITTGNGSGGSGGGNGSGLYVEGGYRYSFNGKEQDPEISGDGNQYDYGFRIYNPRLGRFLSVDPLTKEYPGLTPYQYAENSPILFIDLDGLEKALPWYLRENRHGGKPVLTFGLGNVSRAKRIEDYENKSALSKAGTFAWNVVASAWNGIADTWNEAMDGKTASDMLHESVRSIENLKVEDFKKIETWENVGGAALTAYATKRFPTGKKIKLVADLPAGTQTAGFSLSRSGSSLVKKVSEFKLTHSVETITNSADYKSISKLSDEDLIKSATNPKDYKMVTVNTETGTLFDGNTRIFELQRRKLNVDVPYQEYIPDNSMFPKLKEPPKKP
jgi:RHS repeat-associated protein